MGGETTTAMTKKRKKKGRPSLLDIQKRTLKQQQQQQLHQQNPNSFIPNNRRSARQNPNFHPNDHEDDDDDERKQKKHKLLLGLDNYSNSHHHRQQQFPILNASDALNRRNISSLSVPTGSDQAEEKVSKATDTLHGSPVDSGPTTPLPDKKLLVFVLDRLQKKDTYGVFSEPVDPEELPDYHEIIAHPMDFATVRKKLDRGAYANLEHFEKDVYLICSNAMQYNGPDTIYFRQARSILELAKKDFENLRQDSDSEPQPQPRPKVARRGRPPKILKKSLDTSPSDRVACDFSSDAILASGGDNGSWSRAQNLRKGPMTSFRFRTADALNRAAHGSYNVETSSSLLYEWENEFPASVVKAVLKYGKKQFTLDENRRDSYKDALSSGHEPSVFTTFEGELKQLMVVGLNSEHSYARSLARFAADLGPTVWKIASKKIECILPDGVKFNPGWVGENRPTEPQQQHCYAEKQKFSNNNLSFDHSSRLLSPPTSGSNSAVGNRYSAQVEEDMDSLREVNTQSSAMFPNNTLSGLKPAPPFQSQSTPVIQSDMNGFIGAGGFGLNSLPQVMTGGLTTPPGNRFDNSLMPSQMLGTNSYRPGWLMPANNHDTNVAMLADCSSGLHPENSLVLASASRSHTAADLVLEGDSSWQGLPALNKQDFHTYPPDLNVRFLAPGSPMSKIQISSPQQPDLALQL